MEVIEKVKPKFALIEMAGCTYVFMDGKCISEGIEDITYHAKNEEGRLEPTIDMKINIRDFSFENGKTLEEFFEDVRKKGENLKLK